MTPALELVGLEVPIAGTMVVCGVDLAVEPGELLALVGPSGCGKSTLLRAVAGLVRPSAGTVRLNGVAVDALPPERRRVGLVFQDHALFPHLTVAANIAFGLAGRSRREKRDRVAELLDLVRLPDSGVRYPHELSGGEQQRIALARVLAPSPSVVLLDEPFASLDTALRDELQAEVVEVLGNAKATAILVTHDRDEALSLGHRVAVMQHGRIEQVGEPAVVFHQPASRFVASFLGPASFLPVWADRDYWCTALGPVEIEGRDPSSPDLVAGDLTIMLRPHDMRVEVGDDAVVVARRFVATGFTYDVRLRSGELVQAEGGHSVTVGVGERCAVRLVASHPLVVVR